MSSNNIGGETGWIKASEVEGESKEVGAKVIYQGREMVVSKGVDSDGELKLSDVTGVLAIADALKVNGVLTDLNLYGNNIGDEGAATLGEVLRGNGVLTCLNVGYNNLGGETDYIKASEVEGESKEVGDKVIYEGREMIVSKGVDSDGDLKLIDAVQSGVLAIAKALEVNEVLTSLNMGNNEIGPTGATAIAEALRGNEVLKHLDIRVNCLGDEGEGAIRDAVSWRVGFELEM